MGHTLRAFKRSDVRGIRELIFSILEKEYPFDRKAYSDSDLDAIDSVYGGPREGFFVIESEGIIVGTVGVKEDSPHEALMRRLFVDAGSRNLGYGTQLLRAAIGFCSEKGYRKVYFRCTDRMTGAMKLCIKAGFDETETLEVSGFKIHKLERDI